MKAEAEKRKRTRKLAAKVSIAPSPVRNIPAAVGSVVVVGYEQKPLESASKVRNGDRMENQSNPSKRGGGGPTAAVELDVFVPTMPGGEKVRTAGPVYTPDGYGPQSTMESYHLIDNSESCRMAMTIMCADGVRESTQLKHVCDRHVVALHLDGSGLGTTGERVSLIKVRAVPVLCGGF